MQVVEVESQMPELPGQMVVTIGNFDGVHRGHQAVICAAKELAAARKTKVAVITFDPHPAVLLKPDSALGILTPLAVKRYVMESLGIHYFIVIKTGPGLLGLSPEQFIQQYLFKLSPNAVVEGPDFNFGSSRSGNLETLRQFAAGRFEVIEVPFNDFRDKGVKLTEKCSSTAIRQLLEQGNVRQAAQILGRPYRLIGKTVPGRGIGRQMGYPTANLQATGQIIPAEGVYAGYVVIGDKLDEVAFGGLRRPAAVSIGRTQTVAPEHPLLVEAHLLENKVESLRGKWLGIDFMRFLRPQQRFDSKDLLKAQIARDVERAERMLF
ncbi:MAG: riboflavin biosynthesis protein RibF [Planctomycetaceae bacterium]|nr:riboflavin biosynthesis protein RibF [Planctomycetaceae bacterium]